MTQPLRPARREVIYLLSRLVSCPSVNPNDSPVSGPPYGEDRLAELLKDILSGWGAEVEVAEIFPHRPNLVARFPGTRRDASLMLEAHADTVSVEGMTIPPFEPNIRGDFLYGRGACDDKGSMTAMLLAVKSVLDADGGLPVDVLFVATCNEERGASGAKALMSTGLRADMAVVGEPTNLEIVLAHKGVLRWRIRTHGIAAHSSTPEQGVNAISTMASLIGAMEERLGATLARRSHPFLGSPTLSVGTVRGGTQVNVIPAECEIEVDRRLLPDESPEQATKELEEEIAALQKKVPDLRYDIEQIEYYPPLETDRDSPVARRAANACKAVLGEARYAAAPWGADSGHFNQAGIPSILFGPGSIEQAHKAEEYVSLDQVASAAAVYAEIIRSFNSGE
jgi:acetylornithine deacetylase